MRIACGIGVFALALISGLVMPAAPLAYAQSDVMTAQASGEILHLMRREKLDLILPGAMRDNNVDMWIHVTRQGDPDPMAQQFGSAWGYIVFTDRGSDRIERALFGGGGNRELFDIIGSREIRMAIAGYDYGHQDFSVYDELRDFVAERDPATIAVNTSDWLAIADGISHSQYVKLEKILGPEYTARIVSAENVITDFRVRRTQREIVAYANALEIHRHILERALSNEVIAPGRTTLGEVGAWVREQFHQRGLLRSPDSGAGSPGVLYSASESTSGRFGGGNYVIQRGDFLSYDTSVRYLDYFSTDYKRNAYILRAGETAAPASIQHAFDRAVGAREIIRGQIRVGRTAGETLAAIVEALEAADYIYTPFVDIGEEDYMLLQEALINTDRSGFSIDLHSQGNNSGSLVTVGPSVAPFRSDRDHLVIQENHMFSFEYMVHTNLLERPGYPVSINIEGNHLVTSRGVEYLYPPNERILLVH
jgi:Xaa-Pro dipeptidase